MLAERMGQPVSRDEILSRVWGLEASSTNRTVDNFFFHRQTPEENREEPREAPAHSHRLRPRLQAREVAPSAAELFRDEDDVEPIVTRARSWVRRIGYRRSRSGKLLRDARSVRTSGDESFDGRLRSLRVDLARLRRRFVNDHLEAKGGMSRSHLSQVCEAMSCVVGELYPAVCARSVTTTPRSSTCGSQEPAAESSVKRRSVRAMSSPLALRARTSTSRQSARHWPAASIGAGRDGASPRGALKEAMAVSRQPRGRRPFPISGEPRCGAGVLP